MQLNQDNKLDNELIWGKKKKKKKNKKICNHLTDYIDQRTNLQIYILQLSRQKTSPRK